MIYVRKAMGCVSKQGHIQLPFYSKARSGRFQENKQVRLLYKLNSFQRNYCPVQNKVFLYTCIPNSLWHLVLYILEEVLTSTFTFLEPCFSKVIFKHLTCDKSIINEIKITKVRVTELVHNSTWTVKTVTSLNYFHSGWLKLVFC